MSFTLFESSLRGAFSATKLSHEQYLKTKFEIAWLGSL
jgi:hypothetical protein